MAKLLSLRQRQARALLLSALPVALVCIASGCADENLEPGAFYDGTPGASGAFYRPLRPTITPGTPGLAGAAGLDPSPGLNTGGAPGYVPGGGSGSAGEGGTLGFGAAGTTSTAGTAGSFGF
jgi:hypothetical protein